VTRNDNPWMKTLDDTNTLDPLVPLGRSPESEHLVDLIVSDVTGNDGIERRTGCGATHSAPLEFSQEGEQTRHEVSLGAHRAILVPFRVLRQRASSESKRYEFTKDTFSDG